MKKGGALFILLPYLLICSGFAAEKKTPDLAAVRKKTWYIKVHRGIENTVKNKALRIKKDRGVVKFLDGQWVVVLDLFADGSFTADKGELKPSEDSKYPFQLIFPFLDQETTVDFNVKKKGEEKGTAETVLMDAKEIWKDFLKANASLSLGRKALEIIPKLGLSLTSYSETSFIGTSLTLLEVEVQAIYQPKFLPDRLAFSGLVLFSVLPLGGDAPDAGRYFGGNLGLRYLLPLGGSSWKFYLMGGWYYLSMLVDNNAYGFRHANGPQLYPEISYHLNDKNQISTFFRFSPVQFSFEGQELSVGLNYRYRLSLSSALVLGGEYSQVHLSLASGAFLIDSQSVRFRVGYSF